MKNPRICIVVAIGSETRAIGNGNQLLWHIPEDLKRFKKLTIDKPVIMGRKTFESILEILGKPLPNRHNIVITRQEDYTYQGADVVHSLEDALALARKDGSDEIHIGGGQQIYEQSLPFVDRLYLTVIQSDKDGNTHFPAEYKEVFTKELEREEKEYDGLHYTWLTLEK